MNNSFELRVQNSPLYFVEMVSCLNLCVENPDYPPMPELIDTANRDFLSRLSTFQLKGLEFFEFALHISELTELSQIVECIRNIPDIEFIYILLGGAISKENIEAIFRNSNNIKEYISNCSFFEEMSLDVLETLIKDTDSFREGFIQILHSLDRFIKYENVLNYDIYSEKLLQVSKELKEKPPLTVAQEIMGKKFKRIYDFNKYIFVPSYYFRHKPMRIFNETTQLLVYPVNPVNSAADTVELAKILRIMGDKNRLEIMKLLSDKPYSGKEIAGIMRVTTPTISHHLDLLKSVLLVHEERDKNTKYFSLNKAVYKELLDSLNKYL
ncbi:MAG TPA: metalloregulator ArsR/SmtB family transcription factor [Clostridia bacterium]|nr:metalloregulator ArsR/SmtB family transcription factor [Clostridia bacterium]